MPATLITVTEAGEHLRLDLNLVAASPVTYDDERLPALLVKMAAAEAIILDYLKVDPAAMTSSPPTWPAKPRDLEVVRAAILLILSALWDDAPERTVADYMKRDGTVALLLARLRDPAIA